MLTLVDEPDLSEDLHLTDELNTYAEGPFKLSTPVYKDGILAVDLNQSGLSITVWDGGSGVIFTDQEFDAKVSNDGKTITFTGTSEDAGEYIITPASQEDLREEYSHLTFTSDEEAVTVVRGLIRRVSGSAFGVYTGGKLTDLGLVIEENADNVLGLYVINRDGTFKRENGAWVGIDPEDEDANDEIEGGLWVEVLDGAKGVFDEKEDTDTLTLSEFDGFIL